MLLRRRQEATKASFRMRVEDVTGKFPGLLGVSNNTHDLVDSCVFMSKRVMDDIVGDAEKGTQRKSQDYLDKVSTLGPNAGALTLHMLPDLTERILGCDIESTEVELHPGERETTDLTLKVDVKINREFKPQVKLMFVELVESHIGRYLYDKSKVGD